MKRFVVTAFLLLLGIGFLAEEADARGRLGGGRSLGAQRHSIAPAPAQQVQPAKQAAPTGAQPGARRWLAPLAGLAAGLGLGWLFAQGGLGAALSVLMIVLAGGFVFMLLARALARPRAGSDAGMQYAGLGNETVAAPPPSQLPLADTGAAPDYRSQFRPDIPAGFDADAFLRQAKRNFVALQEANDHGNLETLREVTTREMFQALKDGAGRPGESAQTEVVTLNAALLQVMTESRLHWASVRFSGTLREDPRDLPVPFEETWHLQKPVDGSSGWLLAGIQQAD